MKNALIENDKALYDVWKRIAPVSSYVQGDNECVGRMFIPTEKNRDDARKDLEALQKGADEVRSSFLASIKMSLEIMEPYMVVAEIAGGLYSYLVKKAPKEAFTSFLVAAASVLDAVGYLSKQEWTTEIKVMTANHCASLLDILKTVKAEGHETSLLESKVKAFMNAFNAVAGGFELVFPYLEKHGEGFGREDVYHDILKTMYGYPEVPEDIEEQAIDWMKRELPAFHASAMNMSDILGCDATVAAVEQAVAKTYTLHPDNTIAFLRELRTHVQPIVEKHIVAIDAAYDVRILETPSYLRTFIPSAAMTTLDMLTNKPFTLFYITSSETNKIDALQTLIHEEYGHCVNYINSAANARSLSEIIDSTLSIPITEGISFNREIETLTVFKELTNDNALVFMEKQCGRNWLDATEFIILHGRILRFLRAIYDVRVNTGMQHIPEFIEWAHKQTGLNKKFIYEQTFGLHTFAGHLPAYAVSGMKIAEFQEAARKKGKDIKEFNTYACSMGFPSRRIFDRRLSEWIKR